MGNGFTGVQGNSSEYDVDVAIIGAGPAGLTAGYLLSKKGLKVAIIEKDTRYVGGISRTVEHEGYRFDIGGHRFFSKSDRVMDWWLTMLPVENKGKGGRGQGGGDRGGEAGGMRGGASLALYPKPRVSKVLYP